jgi:hypothetical protein
MIDCLYCAIKSIVVCLSVCFMRDMDARISFSLQIGFLFSCVLGYGVLFLFALFLVFSTYQHLFRLYIHEPVDHSLSYFTRHYHLMYFLLHNMNEPSSSTRQQTGDMLKNVSSFRLYLFIPFLCIYVYDFRVELTRLLSSLMNLSFLLISKPGRLQARLFHVNSNLNHINPSRP